MKKWIICIVSFFILFGGFMFLIGESIFSIVETFLPFIFMGVLIGIGACFYFVGKNIGNNKARKDLKKHIRQLKLDNPYLYFRDIPNKYGIGVSAAILNYKISKEDVLAAILDLCVKGYIVFKQNGEKYEIIDNKKDKSLLLSNELYILEWILNKEHNKINLKRWKELSNNDAINLGLATLEEHPYKSLFKMDTNYAKSLLVVSFIFSLFMCTYINSFIFDGLLNAFLHSIVLSIFMTFPVWFIVFIIMLFIGLLYDGIILSYNSNMNRMLNLTELGKNEFHELYSLGKFLDDFGRFAEKHIDEIIIWEQYLSYAIMFRLGKKILNTGYDKLKINESFIIDDLDKIDL